MIIGDVRVESGRVYTPVGVMRQAHARWQVGATQQQPERIPGWATAAALLLLPCTGGLSLFFLLCREGAGQLTSLRISDGQRVYVTSVFTRDHAEYQAVMRAIAWAGSAVMPSLPQLPS